MDHHFNIEDAKKYGVECAVLLKNIGFWIEKNKANKKHFYEGRYWTYNSAEAFASMFNYWSVSQIRRLLCKLEKEGILISGNFNKAGYDKTKWYSIAENSDVTKSLVDVTESSNGDNEIVTPIPYNKTYNKPYIDIYARKSEFANTLTPFVDTYGRDMINNFYEYWTEPNKTNTKFRQELEKTWSLDRRLKTWNDNNFKRNNNNTKQQKQDEITRIVTQFRIEEEQRQ